MVNVGTIAYFFPTHHTAYLNELQSLVTPQTNAFGLLMKYKTDAKQCLSTDSYDIVLL